MNEYQVIALKELYNYGLRGDHLRHWVSGNCDRFHEGLIKTLHYLIVEKKLTPESAINEIGELTYSQSCALKNMYDLGVRGKDLRLLTMTNCHENKVNVLTSLIKDQQVPINTAINQLNQTGEEAWFDNALASLYTFGLRSDHLFKYKSFCKNNFDFTSDHYSALKYLIKSAMLTPDQAINEISNLCKEAADAISELYKFGLRSSHVRDWNLDTGGYNYDRCKALIVLMRDRGLDVDNALVTLKSIDCSHALVVLSREYKLQLPVLNTVNLK